MQAYLGSQDPTWSSSSCWQRPPLSILLRRLLLSPTSYYWRILRLDLSTSSRRSLLSNLGDLLQSLAGFETFSLVTSNLLPEPLVYGADSLLSSLTCNSGGDPLCSHSPLSQRTGTPSGRRAIFNPFLLLAFHSQHLTNPPGFTFQAHAEYDFTVILTTPFADTPNCRLDYSHTLRTGNRQWFFTLKYTVP